MQAAMRRVSSELTAPDLAFAGAGAVLTTAFALWSARSGGVAALSVLLGLCAFLAFLVGFVAAPHVTVAVTIPYFAALPMLKVLVSEQLAPTKDVIEIAAALAALIVALQRRAGREAWKVDQPLVILTFLLIGLYLLDVGGGIAGTGGYRSEWFHGTRLVAEPLVLMLVGLSLREPRRTLRWAIVSLVLTASWAALVGLFQQVIGPARLVTLGYSYTSQVRMIGGHLRSFGPFDEPFDYATVLALGLAGLLLWWRRGPFAVLLGLVIMAGLAASYVRGVVLSVAALVAIMLARKGYSVAATFLLGAAVVFGLAFIFASTRPTVGPTVQASQSVYVTLNGRTKSWRAAVGGPRDWAFGRGVGRYGTAVQRALAHSGQAPGPATANAAAADSGYLATLSDVGFVGLLIELALFGRLVVLLVRAVQRGEQLAWLGIGLLAVLLLDAALRSSLTGFPTAHFALFLVGLTVAATDRLQPGPAVRAAPR